MNDYLQFVILVLGCVYIITDSIIFSFPRTAIRHALVFTRSYVLFEYGLTLLYCPACMGFWVGLVVTNLFPWPFFIGALAGMLLGRMWGQLFPGTALDTEVLNVKEKASGNSSDG